MEKNIKKKIWFIRHGESLANADVNFKSDDFSAGSVSLSEKGMKQAEELLKHFSDAPDLLITSPYVRTKETAKPLLNKYSHIPQEEWPDTNSLISRAKGVSTRRSRKESHGKRIIGRKAILNTMTAMGQKVLLILWTGYGTQLKK